KTFRAYTLDEAVDALNGCLNKVYAEQDDSQAAYTVAAASGRFAERACAEARSADRVSCQALVEVQGLVITVKGTVMTGDPVLRNLNYSLAQRGGKLLGYSATVDNKAGFLK